MQPERERTKAQERAPSNGELVGLKIAIGEKNGAEAERGVMMYLYQSLERLRGKPALGVLGSLADLLIRKFCSFCRTSELAIAPAENPHLELLVVSAPSHSLWSALCAGAEELWVPLSGETLVPDALALLLLALVAPPVMMLLDELLLVLSQSLQSLLELNRAHKDLVTVFHEQLRVLGLELVIFGLYLCVLKELLLVLSDQVLVLLVEL
ncbi:hypothetical protein DNTS_021702 [Danionella cerebrum]|uniref:Uncharacterized protein n=1 Tax=Danionella cerebrum TaxID=2873325 RepID=A0A553P5C6_9TELE|nr:hypothetical protein DNTS_021702 [Danionella translucida]